MTTLKDHYSSIILQSKELPVNDRALQIANSWAFKSYKNRLSSGTITLVRELLGPSESPTPAAINPMLLDLQSSEEFPPLPSSTGPLIHPTPDHSLTSLVNTGNPQHVMPSHLQHEKQQGVRTPPPSGVIDHPSQAVDGTQTSRLTFSIPFSLDFSSDSTSQEIPSPADSCRSTTSITGDNDHALPLVPSDEACSPKHFVPSCPCTTSCWPVEHHCSEVMTPNNGEMKNEGKSVQVNSTGPSYSDPHININSFLNINPSASAGHRENGEQADDVHVRDEDNVVSSHEGGRAVYSLDTLLTFTPTGATI